MTIDEMLTKLQSLGLKNKFKPYWDAETRNILLHVRKPVKIVDGRLTGSEICLVHNDIFKVWTPRKQKARKIALACNLRVRLLDGEAELHVPPSDADSLLPMFGAKVRRTLSESEMARAKALGERFGRPKQAIPGPQEPTKPTCWSPKA